MYVIDKKIVGWGIILSPPYSIHLTLLQYTSNIYIIAKKDINQPKLKHMVSVQIIRYNSSSALNGEEIGSIDYASMEREFKRKLNLLLDKEIEQDNELSPVWTHIFGLTKMT